MTTEVAARATEPTELVLDPFAYQPGIASKIKGLGGHAAGHDPDYVLHTPYVEVAEGPAQFSVRFRGLTAKKGTLVLRVHMLGREEGARARLANAERIALNRLIQHGSEATIRFEGFHNVTVALYAAIAGDTDAEAEDVAVTLDRPADPGRRKAVAAEAKSTAFGTDRLKPSAHLTSTAIPSIADPVSQIATAPQLVGPVAEDWLARVRMQDSPLAARWRAIYTLQSLRRYGMLEPGARGLGFERTPSGVPGAVAGFGASALVAFPDDGPVRDEASFLERVRRRATCDQAAFLRNVSVRLASWTNIADDLVNYDFVWSSGACEQLGSIQRGTDFLQEVMGCLRPGGLAVHTMAYDLESSAGQLHPDSAVPGQQEVERMSLVLISRGHEVAQFKVNAPNHISSGRADMPGASVVGLIVRKARLPD